MKIFTDICKMPKKSSRGKGLYKFPKLSELAGYYRLNEENVLKFAKKLFKDYNDEITFHDARYDTTVMYVACKLRAEEIAAPGTCTGEWTKLFRRPMSI